MVFLLVISITDKTINIFGRSKNGLLHAGLLQCPEPHSWSRVGDWVDLCLRGGGGGGIILGDLRGDNLQIFDLHRLASHTD